MSKPLSANLDHLDELLSGLEELKEIVRNLIYEFPDDLKTHRVYCAYTGKILETIKTRAQVENMDPDWLLSEALKTVALFLAENGEIGAANLVGNHVEEIEEKVKQIWWQPQEIKVSSLNIKQEHSLESSSNHLVKPVKGKKKTEEPGQ
ncbi:MAG: hypothetical protein H8E42_09235 [Nitrospinae bacterium]|nr:hypothetical protein [Nitrospinota bacterium]MBL7020707.1 hypothetical protein [Nitrospinaceae bacterium]